MGSFTLPGQRYKYIHNTIASNSSSSNAEVVAPTLHVRDTGRGSASEFQAHAMRSLVAAMSIAPVLFPKYWLLFFAPRLSLPQHQETDNITLFRVPFPFCCNSHSANLVASDSIISKSFHVAFFHQVFCFFSRGS
jgi:hypothetical protein